MRNVSRRIAIPTFICGFLMLGTVEAKAQKPDFSGIWTLDVDKSDNLANRVRTGAGNTKSFTKIDVQRIVDRLAYLSRTSEELELEQTDKDLKIFDKDDNVRIYYIDGKKHPRQTPWGAQLQTVTNWNGDDLVIVTESKELGKVTEVYTFEGEQLVFVIQMENKDFESNVVARHYYNRKGGQ